MGVVFALRRAGLHADAEDFGDEDQLVGLHAVPGCAVTEQIAQLNCSDVPFPFNLRCNENMSRPDGLNFIP